MSPAVGVGVWVALIVAWLAACVLLGRTGWPGALRLAVGLAALVALWFVGVIATVM